MENSLIAEFENLKISALTKYKSINSSTHIHNVTIGPNSKVLEDSSVTNGQNSRVVTDSTNGLNSRVLTDSTNTTNVPSSRVVEDSTNVTNRPNNRVLENVTPKKISQDINGTPERSHTSSLRLRKSPLPRMLVEAETQRVEEVQSAVQARMDKMQATVKQLETYSKLEWAKKQHMLIEKYQREEDVMIKTLEEFDRQASDILQHRQVQLQKQAEERNKRQLELQIKEKQRHQLLLVIEEIQKQQHAFRLIYQEIVQCLKECNIASRGVDSVLYPVVAETSDKLRTLTENMERLKDKCKAGTVVCADLELSAAVVREANKLKESFQTVIAKKLEEEKQRVELSKPVANVKPVAPGPVPVTSSSTPAPPAAASQPVLKIPTPAFPVTSVPPAPAPTASQPTEVRRTEENSIVGTFVSRSSLKLYYDLQQFMETYTNNFAPLAKDPQLKQFRFHCQKAVNIPLNAISAVSPQHLLDKYHRLSNLLKGITVEAGGSNVLSSQHPHGIAYCTDLLAKKFVLQGDLLISSNPESAYCYAAMIVTLWNEFPDFGRLVLAYFHKSVPYLVPMYPPQVQGQSDQDYYLSLGYNYVNGVIEKQDKFLKRMSGIMRLYAAITICRPKRGQQGTHPHGLANGWRWIAGILNLEPRADITATVLFEFLEVAGSSMLAAYGVQFQKILNFIHDIYLPMMLKVDSGGPVCRLEALMQKIKKTGQIDPPKGRLPEDFW